MGGFLRREVTQFDLDLKQTIGTTFWREKLAEQGLKRESTEASINLGKRYWQFSL